MGLLNEIIGAVVAEEAVDKLDPNAGFLKKGLAAIAGFEGEQLIEEKNRRTRSCSKQSNSASLKRCEAAAGAARFRACQDRETGYPAAARNGQQVRPVNR